MRGTVKAAVPVALAALLAAGCGTVRPRPAANGSGAGGMSVSPGVLGPATITKAEAERLAQTLLGRAVVPPGAHVLAGRPPAAIRQAPGWLLASPTVRLDRIWTVRQPASSVYDLISRHVPAGMRLAGNGQGSTSTGVTQESVDYSPSRLPTGVNQESLTMSVVPSGAVTLLRADVQVVWYPPRSDAEHIPAGLPVVTVTASYLGAAEPRTVRKTFTSAALAGRLAAMLNGAHASVQSLMSCPLARVTYTFAFAASRTARPYLVANEEGCGSVGITVNGRQQPALQTPAGLDQALSRLTGGPTGLPRSARIPPTQ
jgi:hypothetical protein